MTTARPSDLPLVDRLARVMLARHDERRGFPLRALDELAPDAQDFWRNEGRKFLAAINSAGMAIIHITETTP